MTVGTSVGVAVGIGVSVIEEQRVGARVLGMAVDTEVGTKVFPTTGIFIETGTEDVVETGVIVAV